MSALLLAVLVGPFYDPRYYNVPALRECRCDERGLEIARDCVQPKDRVPVFICEKRPSGEIVCQPNCGKRRAEPNV